MGSVGEGRRLVNDCEPRRRMWLGPISALVAFSVCLVAAASASAFSAQGSAEQVYATGLPANAQASLVKNGATVATQNADSLGGVLFRLVKPGKSYRVTSGSETSGPITVHNGASAPWDPEIYNQSIPDNGYTYLTTRDGTQLSIDVHPPSSPAGEPGAPSMFNFPTLPIAGVPTPSYAPPYPTIIEYSGYGYANPAGPENGIAVLANLMGFAVVDVNMRGTGCSGGAYDFFEKLQNLDGYDVIETIAHQPWVLGNKVGMLGISYGGISQLFTAQTQPARPRGDRAAVGDRRDGDDAVPRRHPQRRLRRRVGRRAPAERRTGESRPRPGVGDEADRRRRHDLRGQPGPARRGGEPDGKDRSKLDVQPVGGRSAGPGHVRATRSTCRRSWRASSRTSRRAGTAPIWPSTSRAPPTSGSRSPTARTSTRSIRGRTTGCTTSWSCTSPTKRRSKTRHP